METETNRIVELVNELDFEGLSSEIKNVSKTGAEKRQLIDEILSRFADKIIEATKNDSFAVKVALLYKFGDSVVTKALLEKRNEDYLRAAVLLKYLNGYDPESLRNQYDLISAMFTIQLIQNGKNTIDVDVMKAILKSLSDYLNTMDMEVIKEMQKEDLSDFVMNLAEVHEVIFRSDRNRDKSKLIDKLFLNEDLSNENLNYLYNEIILKNSLLRNYDFSSILFKKPEYIIEIKGMYRRLNRELFDVIFDIKNKSEFEDTRDLLREVLLLNSDDIEGLKWFFSEVNKRFINNPELYQFMQDETFYKAFANVNFEKINEENLQRFLNGNSDVNELIINSIGTYSGFLDNFDTLVDMFIKSNDKKYKHKLMIPLVVALIEKQKKKYGLNFEVVFSSKALNDAQVGSFNQRKNTMYINPNIVDIIDDTDVAFIHAVDTVFHETRHALQHKEIETREEFDFDNLVMAMDYHLSYNEDNYYAKNYAHISFERDARDIAYVETMSFFEKYPNIQKLVKKEREDDYHLSDYIRKETLLGEDTYYGLIYHFIENISVGLKTAKEEPEYRDQIFERIKRYPVLFKFFDIDFDNYCINIKDGDYYMNLLKKSRDTDKEKTVEYSVESFLYSLRMGKYLNEKSSNSYTQEEGYNKEVIKEIDDNVRRGISL